VRKMIVARRLLAVSAIGAASAAASTLRATNSPSTPGRSISLTSSSRSHLLPTTVLVHGLDSSKETFSGTLARLVIDNYPCISLDLRGHGESPFGEVSDFSAPALAADVLEAIKAHGITRAVLVGHSMGGRIAMRAAALDAASSEPVLRAVVIEDMDLIERYAPSKTVEDRAALERFASPGGRRFASWEEARAALLPWYDRDEERINSWRNTRVRPIPGGTEVHSDINPAAQRLARERVLASSDGSMAWDELAAHGDSLPFALHVLYADKGERGTVVQIEGRGGINDMKARCPAAQFTFFPGAGHSIHRTDQEAFDKQLREIIKTAAQRD
jgi:pimeloyl-ACP methyl ester carboxylesterase